MSVLTRFFLIRSEISSCRPTLQGIQPIHLNALNTTILHLNILHAPEPLTWPSPPVLIFSHRHVVLITTGCFSRRYVTNVQRKFLLDQLLSCHLSSKKLNNFRELLIQTPLAISTPPASIFRQPKTVEAKIPGSTMFVLFAYIIHRVIHHPVRSTEYSV
jgi:hypothetical protein